MVIYKTVNFLLVLFEFFTLFMSGIFSVCIFKNKTQLIKMFTIHDESFYMHTYTRIVANLKIDI